MALKWNYERDEYDSWDLPDGATLFSPDMDAKCQCAECGRWMTCGWGYTSLKIHNEIGLGYCVCRECYDKEWEEEKRAQAEKKRKKKDDRANDRPEE